LGLLAGDIEGDSRQPNPSYREYDISCADTSVSCGVSEQAESLRHHLNETDSTDPKETLVTEGKGTLVTEGGNGEARPPDNEGLEFSWKRPLEEAAEARSQEDSHGTQQEAAAHGAQGTAAGA
jgi:hypothetical protein